MNHDVTVPRLRWCHVFFSGLGKTIQTLAFLSALKCLGVTGPHLVVVPLSTVGNWAREIRRFTSQLSFSKICGSRVEREHSISDGGNGDSENTRLVVA